MSAIQGITLPSMPWQDDAWKRLSQACATGRLHHAILLRGPAGLGKAHLAARLAAGLLCQEGRTGLDACAACKACRLREVGNHPDLHQLEPEEGKRTIGVDAVREIIEALFLTSQSDGTKVVIVRPADCLTHTAANTLLKTLEEPPGACVFILISHRAGLLPATVRSRCQQIGFSIPPEAEGLAWLNLAVAETDLASTEVTLNSALRASNGGPVGALQLLGSGSIEAHERILSVFVSVCAGELSPTNAAEMWRESGLEPVLDCLDRTARELARLRLAGGLYERELEGRAEKPVPSRAAVVAHLDLDRILGLHAACVALRRAISGGSGLNEQLCLERLALRCRAMTNGD